MFGIWLCSKHWSGHISSNIRQGVTLFWILVLTRIGSLILESLTNYNITMCRQLFFVVSQWYPRCLTRPNIYTNRHHLVQIKVPSSSMGTPITTFEQTLLFKQEYPRFDKHYYIINQVELFMVCSIWKILAKAQNTQLWSKMILARWDLCQLNIRMN